MKWIFALGLSFILFNCNPTHTPPASNNSMEPKMEVHEKPVILNHPKNIIFMVGDGMGLTQITAGMYSNDNYLHLERCPIVGLHKAYSYDNLITDSAAGATAFSTGQKTYNGAIGVGPDTMSLPTILEEAEDNALATGMVTTSTIVHATPASFISHVKARRLYEDIAEDFLDTEIDLFIGGGKKYFDRRDDDRDLLKELGANGYQISSYFDTELDDLVINYGQNLGYFTADSDPLTVSQGRTYLKNASALACDFLDQHNNQNGFFLMIEGAQIDWGGHAENSDYIITEMLDFNGAIGAVLDFAEKDGNTLVIITADHETGGYAINPGSKQDSIVGAFTSNYHTGTMVPVFAYGPGAELFAGIYENTAIYEKMRKAFDFKGELE